MNTILLTQTEIQKLLDPTELLPELIEAFRSYSLNRKIPAQRARSSLKLENTSAIVLFPGLIEHVPAYTIKNHAKFPQETPAIKGVIHLYDIETGALLAIMDSTYITAVRTGLSGAIGTHLLAKKNAEKIAVIGAGTQGKMQLLSLRCLRDFSEVFIYDTVRARASMLINEIKAEIDADFYVCQTLEEAVSDVDIIITATWSREPFLSTHMVKEGVHITTLGPDEPNKAEVSAELIKQASFYCDDRELAVKMGAIGGVGLDSSFIHAEIGEVINDEALGRISNHQITIYGSVGLAFQDLAAAWQVYRKAKELNIGENINFLE
ncbi:ornithine cyclodeaminase family protein [Bacillus canaveralius]|uniref:ornithine cyclodeaminase family protein n=1 Tax=Bacillus canaveralius TaxID=1403243 RepID=UPI000F7B02A8|nr:ornithine cyclodeaminase family protein [Bacillus canaveralius]RSK57902.1 ornithine cyclodeaminase family protein [Bacillus canaveralius]